MIETIALTLAVLGPVPSRADGPIDFDRDIRPILAARCLSCHVQTVYDGDLCVACGRCTDVCPHACLSLVPGADVAVDPGSPAPHGLVRMLKDEERCIRCGLCAERCPTGAMTMERLELVLEDAVA